jgi:hypothetical protein
MLFTDMPAREYHALNRISQSAIKRLLRSPAHYRAWLDAPPSPSAAMQFGTAVHSILFDPPEVRPSVLAVVPADAPTRRSNEGKRWWAEFEATNKGKTFMDRDVFLQVRSIADAVYEHPRASALLSAGGAAREGSRTCEDLEGGVEVVAARGLGERTINTLRRVARGGREQQGGDRDHKDGLRGDSARRGANETAAVRRAGVTSRSATSAATIRIAESAP